MFDDTKKNERICNLAKEHIKNNMLPDAVISETKQLSDFNGNDYVLFELNPIGYMIYHIDSGKFVEWAKSSFSPYIGLFSNLYYGGAMQYYYFENKKFQHTLKKNLTLPFTYIKRLSADCKFMYDSFMKLPSVDNLNYVKNNSAISEAATVIGVLKAKEDLAAQTPVKRKWFESKRKKQSEPIARVGTSAFFKNANSDTTIGYKSGAASGYVAANLLLAYNFFAFDYGLIRNLFYVDIQGKFLTGSDITDELLRLSGENPASTTFNAVSSRDVYDAVGKYLDDKDISFGWAYLFNATDEQLKSTLNEGFPFVFFNGFNLPPKGDKNVNHAFVAYDYATYGFLNLGIKYRVHFGIAGYSSVWLDSPVFTSNFLIKIDEQN